MSQSRITFRLKKGLMRCTSEQRLTIKGLGLKRRMGVSTLENTPAVRGMIKKVIHLVEIISEK